MYKDENLQMGQVPFPAPNSHKRTYDARHLCSLELFSIHAQNRSLNDPGGVERLIK